MIEYIKKPYASPITGVINTETGWKITRDVAGLEIIDEVPLSTEMVDRYASNILVPIGSKVYIWYRMKLSNGEIKQYIGPFEYESRDSNITNDLKPITRVDTPTLTVKDNTVATGEPLIKFSSSLFRGDALDGHLATTWCVKSPNGDILAQSLKSVPNRTEFTINRVTTDIHRFTYVDVYIQHHSNNGATSEFGVERIQLNVYPFKYDGPIYIDHLRPYTFNIIPMDSTNPNIKKIEIVDLSTDTVVHSFTNMLNLTFTVPAGTLNEGTTYEVRSFVNVLAGPTYNYYPRLEIQISTLKYKTSLTYDRDATYSLGTMNSFVDTGIMHSAIGNYKIVDKKAIVRLDNNLVRVIKDGVHFVSESIILDTAVEELLQNDFRVFNTRYDRVIIVSRINDVIKINSIVDINGTLFLDPSYTPIELPCEDTDHNLLHTAVICLDEEHIFLTRKLDTQDLVVDIVDIQLGTMVRHQTLPVLNYGNIDMTKYVPVYSDYKAVTAAAELDGKLILFKYNITEGYWVQLFESDEEFVSGVVYEATTLKDLSILFTKTTTNTSELIYVNSIGELKPLPTTIVLDTFTFSVVDTNGAISFFDVTNNKVAKLEMN